jgi:hypothetical protein
MGAPLGFKTFTTGDVLTAADTNGYLMQGIWTFASAAARNAAVTSPQEGNFCFLKDTNATQFYDGAAWTNVGGGGGGKVLQVVQATYSTATTIASTSFTDTGLSVAITPSSATSKVLILGSQSLFLQRSNKLIGGGLQLVRTATSIMDQAGTNTSGVYLEGTGLTDAYLGSVNPINYLDSPATTSATTYKVQAKVNNTTNSGAVVCQYGSIVSTLIALEIGA